MDDGGSCSIASACHSSTPHDVCSATVRGHVQCNGVYRQHKELVASQDVEGSRYTPRDDVPEGLRTRET